MIKLEDDITRFKYEINTTEELDDKPKTKGNNNILNNMPTTEKSNNTSSRSSV